MAAANKLVTTTAFRKVPLLYSQEHNGDDAVARVKFFCPQNGWRWYVTEYDPEHKMAFGLVQGFETELGYISVAELQDMNDNWRQRYPYPPIERDLYFKPMTVGEIKKKIEAGNAP